MEPVKFEGANDVLCKPGGSTEEDCGDMIIHRGYDPSWNNYPVITSCWEPSAEEREEFLRTGKLYFRSWGNTMYPISLSVFNPVEHGWVRDGRPINPDHALLKK